MRGVGDGRIEKGAKEGRKGCSGTSWRTVLDKELLGRFLALRATVRCISVGQTRISGMV